MFCFSKIGYLGGFERVRISPPTAEIICLLTKNNNIYVLQAFDLQIHYIPDFATIFSSSHT